MSWRVCNIFCYHSDSLAYDKRVVIVWLLSAYAHFLIAGTFELSQRFLDNAMLKNIDPLLNADVLSALRAMGHGDYLVVSDTNFPADSVARQTVLGKLLRIDAVSAPQAIKSILSVMPLDSFIDDAAQRMEVVGAPGDMPAVQSEVQSVIDAAEGKPWPMVSVERFAFYDRAKQAYAVIVTGERRFYGCFILTKGVIAPDD